MKYKIKGKVSDFMGNPLYNANVIILDKLSNGIGNWEPADDNDLGLGGTLHPGSDDELVSADIIGNTAALGTNNYLGHWDVTPEPATLSILALGGLALTKRKRR